MNITKYLNSLPEECFYWLPQPLQQSQNTELIASESFLFCETLLYEVETILDVVGKPPNNLHTKDSFL